MSPANEIRRQYSWKDQTVYRWNFWNKDPGLVAILAWLFTAAIFPLLICGALWLIALVVPNNIAFGVGVVAAVIGLLNVLFLIYQAWLSDDGRSSKSGLSSLAIGTLGSFIFLVTVPASPLGAAFVNGATASFWDWLLFFLDNLASVVLLDIPEVFDLRLSVVTYESQLSRAMTLTTRIVMTIGLVEFVRDVWRSRQSQQLVGTVRECYFYCADFQNPEDIKVRCEAKLTPLVSYQRLDVMDFIAAFEKEGDAEERGEA